MRGGDGIVARQLVGETLSTLRYDEEYLYQTPNNAKGQLSTGKRERFVEDGDDDSRAMPGPLKVLQVRYSISSNSNVRSKLEYRDTKAKADITRE